MNVAMNIGTFVKILRNVELRFERYGMIEMRHRKGLKSLFVYVYVYVMNY
jgi:hypothetical protein